MIPRVGMVRALRRAASGVHRPPVVLATDGHEYVLKLGDRDADFPACELVAAMLAPCFGVETAAFALVEIPEGVRALLAPLWPDFATPPAGGVAFGSRWIARATPWTAALAGLVADRDSVARLFAFDVYVENDDRRTRNPNVLLTGDRLVAIDHGDSLPGVQGRGYVGPFSHEAHVGWPVLTGSGDRLAALAETAPSDDDIDRAIDVVPPPWWPDPGRATFAQRALRDRREGFRATLSRLTTP